jgi:hypothetical protein
MKDLNVSQLKEQIKHAKVLGNSILFIKAYQDKERDYKVVVSILKFPKEKATINLKLVTEDITTCKNYNLSEVKDAVAEVNRFYKTGEIN